MHGLWMLELKAPGPQEALQPMTRQQGILAMVDLEESGKDELGTGGSATVRTGGSAGAATPPPLRHKIQ